MKLLVRGWSIGRRRGFFYLLYLLNRYLMPKIAYSFLSRVSRRRVRQAFLIGGLGCGLLIFIITNLLTNLLAAGLFIFSLAIVGLIVRLSIQKLKISHMRRLAQALLHKAQSRYSHDTFTSWACWPVGTHVRDAVDLARKSTSDDQIVIGRIDNDGRALGLFGELPGLKNIGEADFVKRYRYPLDIVLIGDKVLLRKDFQGDQVNFLREWYNLSLLYGKANVPAVHHVNESSCVLYKNLIPGPTLRNALVDMGAKILNVQTDDDSELAGLHPLERLEAILARGTELIPSTISEMFLCKMEDQLDKIHAPGIAKLSLTFGNIIMDSKEEPWFIDFEGARAYKSTSNPFFMYRRDQDRIKFNKIYGRNLMTERSARAALAEQTANQSSSYEPIDFGHGLATQGFWSTDSSTGLWEFFTKHVIASLIKGKRVLDLGSNNGIMPIMMLREGAKKVVGIEIESTCLEWARLVHMIFEWRDMRKYSFQISNCNMLEILRSDWGKFDVVTAFCSLYYLSETDMAKILRRASELAPIMVVQAKTDTRSEAEENKAEKSSVAFLKKLLEENGYPEVRLFAPKNFTRPLLVATVDSRFEA